MNLEKGAKTDSGNYKLDENIESLDRLYEILVGGGSIFARHRMYPCAFFLSWQIKECKNWLDRGWFWTAIKIDK